MRPISILLCAAAVLAATTTSAAVVIDASTTIDYRIDDDVRIEDGLDPPTLVDVVPEGQLHGETRVRGVSSLSISGGYVRQLQSNDSSSITVLSGGHLDDATVEDLSTLLVRDGRIGDLQAWGCSQVELSEGAFLANTGYVCDAATVNVTDGAVVHDRLTAYNAATINATGGDLRRLSAYDASTLVLSGSELAVGFVSADDASTVHLHGGWLQWGLDVGPSATIHVYGHQLELTETRLTGLLSDYGGIHHEMDDVAEWERFVLHELPEPEPVVIDSNGTIDMNNAFPAKRVEIVDGPTSATTVDIVDGGIVGCLAVNDSALVNHAGGTINVLYVRDGAVADVSGGVIRDYAVASGNGTLRFSGGSARRVDARDSSTVDLLGGEIQGVVAAYDSSSVGLALDSWYHLTEVEAYNNSEVRLTAGGTRGLRTAGQSSAYVSGGSVGWPGINAGGQSTVKVSGGEVRSVKAYDAAAIHLSGGWVQESVQAVGDSLIQVYGYQLAFDGEFLTGFLEDYNGLYHRVELSEAAEVVLHEMPEPDSIVFDTDAVVGADNSFPERRVDVIGSSSGYGRVEVGVGGEVGLLSVHNHCRANLTGGVVNVLESRDRTTVNLSGGAIRDFVTVRDFGTVSLSQNAEPYESLRAVEIRDHGTVNCPDGTVGGLRLFDAGELNFSGGKVGYLEARNQSTANLSGGAISTLMTHDTAVVHVSGGSIARLTTDGTSTVNVSGGVLTRMAVAQGNSTLTIARTESQSGFRVADHGTMNFYGGTFSRSPRGLEVGGFGVLNVYGYDLELSGGYLRGILADVSGILQPVRVSDAGHVVLHELPRPVPVVLDSSTTVDLDNSFPDKWVRVVDGPVTPTVVEILPDAQIGHLAVEGASAVNQSGGTTNILDIGDEGSVEFSGGTIRDVLSLSDNSRAEITGGWLGHLIANDRSTVTISDAYSRFWRRLIANDASSVTISGGNLGELFTYDTSTVNIEGGVPHDITAHDSSAIRVSDSAMIRGSLELFDASFLDFSGEQAGGITANDDSVAVISSGYAGDLTTDDRAMVEVTGGVVPQVAASGHSSVDIYGGRVWLSLSAQDESTIHLYGHDLDLSDGLLTGMLADGSELSVEAHTFDAGQILLHQVPEPSVIVGLVCSALAGFAMQAVRRRRRHRR